MRPEKHSMQHWNRSMIKVYGAVRLADIEASQPAEWNISGATHVRVMLPASSASELNMQERGFFWADRTLKVSISLARRTPSGGENRQSQKGFAAYCLCIFSLRSQISCTSYV